MESSSLRKTFPDDFCTSGVTGDFGSTKADLNQVFYEKIIKNIFEIESRFKKMEIINFFLPFLQTC